MQRVYEQRKVKHATCKNVKGRVWRIQTQLETRIFLSWFRQVVQSYIHFDGDFNPRRVTVAQVHGGLHPRRVQSNLVYPTMAIAHEGLASLAVDLHELGDLLALTNSLVQLHNLFGGSQVTANQSRRHHSPKGNRWCVDDELLALVLQMIVSPTLNSLS